MKSLAATGFFPVFSNFLAFAGREYHNYNMPIIKKKASFVFAKKIIDFIFRIAE
jgi:hypothetical protein